MFIIILKAIPNTKIRFRPALIAGIVAGTLFQITQYFYFKFQIGISNYNAIYGSFAALPLFMIWVHTGWIILIFGANYCYSLQNYEKNEKINIDFENMKYTEKKILYLYILNNIIKNFNEGNPPYDSDMLCKKTNLPPKTVRLILNDLVDSGLLAPTITNEDDDYKYLPTFDINKLTIVDAINIIERKGKNKISYDISEDVNKIKKKLIDLYEKTKALNINVLIKDL